MYRKNPEFLKRNPDVNIVDLGRDDISVSLAPGKSYLWVWQAGK